jgi:hypothetical protein
MCTRIYIIEWQKNPEFNFTMVLLNLSLLGFFFFLSRNKARRPGRLNEPSTERAHRRSSRDFAISGTNKPRAWQQTMSEPTQALVAT